MTNALDAGETLPLPATLTGSPSIRLKGAIAAARTAREGGQEGRPPLEGRHAKKVGSKQGLGYRWISKHGHRQWRIKRAIEYFVFL